MEFLQHILFCLSGVSFQRYGTSKFEQNAFFTKSAAVHNFYIAISPWNLDLNSKSHKIWKNANDMAFQWHIYWKKTLFHTDGSCTLWPKMIMSWGKQLTCLAVVGWPRIKRSLFLKLFLESQNQREKLILWGRNWDHRQDNFLKENYIFFLFFDTQDILKH